MKSKVFSKYVAHDYSDYRFEYLWGTLKCVWFHPKNVTFWFQNIFFVNLSSHYWSSDYLEISGLLIFESTSPVVPICNFSQCYLTNSQRYQCWTLKQFHLITHILNFSQFFLMQFFFLKLWTCISLAQIMTSWNFWGFFLIGSNNWGKFRQNQTWHTNDFA